MFADQFWDLLSKKFSGEASLADLDLLDGMLSDNVALQLEAETLSSIWQQTAPAGDADTNQAFDRHLERMKSKGFELEEILPDPLPRRNASHRFWIKKWWIPSAAIVMAGLIFLFVKPSHGHPRSSPPPEMQLSQVMTKPGSRTQLQLPDGSMVWLNASSSLNYDKNFGKNLREVNLSGEAFFDVVKDPEHPFIIHTKTIDVKVLGTKFNVKAYPDEKFTETSLLRGSVEVTVKSRNEKHFLKPNEKVIVANELEVTRKPLVDKPQMIVLTNLNHLADSTIAETSWVENKLVFQNESFSELAVKMERWYGVTMQFGDEIIKSLRFTGVFEKETVQQALEALQITARFHFTIKNNIIRIS